MSRSCYGSCLNLLFQHIFCWSILYLLPTNRLLRVAPIHAPHTVSHPLTWLMLSSLSRIQSCKKFWASAVLGLWEVKPQRGILSGYYVLQSSAFNCLKPIHPSRSTSSTKPSGFLTSRVLWSLPLWRTRTVDLNTSLLTHDSSATLTMGSTVETWHNSHDSSPQQSPWEAGLSFPHPRSAAQDTMGRTGPTQQKAKLPLTGLRLHLVWPPPPPVHLCLSGYHSPWPPGCHGYWSPRPSLPRPLYFRLEWAQPQMPLPLP